MKNEDFSHEISKQKIDKAVHLSYLDNNQNDKILSFSGGERQRTGIARIFAKDVDIIILDEPTSA